jgi:peptidoglycan/LPS O-acetylase OafA/YrhL
VLFPAQSTDRTTHSTYYRPDIDGLRAVSVLAVIAFHLNGKLSGGYVGVDVFFVISGFLIGGIVLGEVDSDRFSFAHFYGRRVRRILPALITTLIASALAAFLLLGPSEIAPFAKSAVAALLSGANVYFYATSGYFEARSADIPLLHLWSLGLEEQFYVIFPTIVVLLARLTRAALLPFLALAGLASLVWSQHELSGHPQAAFYLLQSRAFELTIGILILWLPKPRFAGLPSLCGCVLLAIALLAFNQNTPFPGLAALLPCAGATLIIWSAANTWIGDWLSTRPIVYLGKISYPLYLAHWPFIVFGKIAMPDLGSRWFTAFVVAGSIAAAAATYHLIERPIRFGSLRRLRWSVAGGCALFAAAIGGILFIPTLDRSFASNQPFIVRPVDFKELYLQGKCFLLPEQDSKAYSSECYPDHRPDVILWGDSHAADLYSGLKVEFAAAGYSLGLLASAACPPILDYPIEGVPFCKANNDFVRSFIETHRPNIVILSAFWKPHHTDLLRETLNRLSKIPGVGVVVIGNTPVFAESVPIYLGRANTASIKVSDRSATEHTLQDWLGRGQVAGVQYVSLKDWTCPRERCLLTDKQGFVYYIDDGHLSADGSQWVARHIVSKILSNRSND